MEPRLKPLGQATADYLQQIWSKPCGLVDIKQIPGGASRETYRLKLQIDGEASGLILRRDPPSSLIDTERHHEFNTYRTVFQTGVMPVPEPLILEEDHAALERPFSIMREIANGQASPAGLDDPAMDACRERLGRTKWTLLGRLASTPISDLPGLTDFMPVPDHPEAENLAYWADVIRSDSLHPQPIAEAAFRWLERNLPEPSGKLCLTHGDYRTGNYLYTASGEITGVLDWEMAHISDPLEDLAWSLDPLWSPQPAIAGRLMTRLEAVGIWQTASGIQIDPIRFKWWQIFASVKALAIWTSSNEDYVNGTTKEPILALAGWPLMDRQSRILMDRLCGDNQHLIAEPVLDLS
ncbi:MAG: phosphotransferase family protein [Pseudomonadota bacterium]